MPINKPGKPGAAAAQVPQAASLNPDDFIEGGGLYDDFDGVIKDIAFTTFDYYGTTDPNLSLAVEIFNENADEEDGVPDAEGKVKNPFVQNYSGGDLKHFVPSDDGEMAVPVGTRTALSKSCAAYRFIMSLVMGGFDKSKIGQQVSVFKGTRAHFKRESQAEVDKDNQGKDFKRKPNLLVEKVLEGTNKSAPKGPGQAAAAKGPGPGGPSKPTTPANRPSPGKATPTAPPPQATNNGLPDEETQGWAGAYIVELLMNNGGSHPKTGLGKGVVPWAAANQIPIPQRNKIIQALGNDTFLGRDDLGWTFDGATLTQSE